MARSASLRVEHRLVAERRAGARVEEVQRHLVRVELGELGGELGALLEGLAHAEDAAAAHLHAGVADHPQRVPALLPGVRGDHVREVATGRSRGCGCSGARPSSTSSSTCSWVSMPSDAAMLMSTAARIAATPSRICAISRSSGPRTAATMQNSVAPVAAVCLAASTSDGMSSQTARTGEVNSPDCEQKWQSSGQPPVLSETMPSTSTSGPHQRIRTSWASCERGRQLLVGQPQHLEDAGLVEADPGRQHLGAGPVKDLWHGRTLQGVRTAWEGRQAGFGRWRVGA